MPHLIQAALLSSLKTLLGQNSFQWFGCILNNSSSQKSIYMENSQPLLPLQVT